MSEEQSVENAPARYGPNRMLRVPCDCCGVCQILTVAEWLDEDGDDGEGGINLSFYTSYRQDNVWRYRIRNAWRSLFPKGGDPYYHDIIITERQARQLGAFLNPPEASP